jgi:hypothetical protein
MRSRALWCLPLVVACSASSTPEGESSDSLIGGRPPASGEIPSVLAIANGCTAARVGPRHVLTAAHCVYYGSLEPQYAAGRTISLRGVGETEASPYTIKKTHVHPTWEQTCTSAVAIGACNRTAADAALIETVQVLPANIPIAPIDAEPMAAGSVVTMAGQGCEDFVGSMTAGSSFSLHRFKQGDTSLLPAEAVLHRGNASPDLVSLRDRYLITPGPAYATPGPGLCPGDSGGPLYRAGGAVVVGINAYYTFSSLTAALPVTNSHTRLDDASSARVGSWLAARGVSICRGASCPGPAAGQRPIAVQENAGLDGEGRDGSCEKALADPAAIQRAVQQALAVEPTCWVYDGRRAAIPASSDYAYTGSVYCQLRTAPAAGLAANFTAAMQAQGYPSFRMLPSSGVSGIIKTAACSTYPTAGERCQSASTDVSRVAPVLARVLGVPVACAVSNVRRYDAAGGWFYYGALGCALTGTPSASAAESFAQSMTTYDQYGYLGRETRFADYRITQQDGRSYVVGTAATYNCPSY